ncbi:MAG TPA: isopentenyl phosphate kinase [Herpetosiphonaceae bacterium]
MSRLRIFIKIGGSILTDKTQPEALNLPALQTVAATIAAVLREQPALELLIGHGGGSFGHYWAAHYGTQRGAHDPEGWQGVARVADAMGRLNRTVVDALLEAGVSAVGVQPMASAQAEAGALRELATPVIERMLGVGLVPVVYGDVVLDTAQGAAIISTEGLFAFLAPRLQPQRIVLVGEAGVYTADPRRDPDAIRIAQITAANIETVLEQTGASHGTDVTGGMATKVRQMWQLVQSAEGLEVLLIGVDAEMLRAVLRGDEVEAGTLIRR